MYSECVDGGNWSCSGWSYGSGSDWNTFSCVDSRPFIGCWRCPSMVDRFLVKYFCTRSDDRPDQEVKNIFLLLLPIHIEWGSSMMRGENPQVWSLTCTHTNSPQNICQEFWTPSLAYFTGSNWACTGLSVDLLYLLSSLSHSLCWQLLQTCNQMWVGIHDHTMFQWTARICWDLEIDILSVLQLLGLVYIVGPCVLKWFFTRLACGWGADW